MVMVMVMYVEPVARNTTIIDTKHIKDIFRYMHGIIQLKFVTIIKIININGKKEMIT